MRYARHAEPSRGSAPLAVKTLPAYRQLVERVWRFGGNMVEELDEPRRWGRQPGDRRVALRWQLTWQPGGSWPPQGPCRNHPGLPGPSGRPASPTRDARHCRHGGTALRPLRKNELRRVVRPHRDGIGARVEVQGVHHLPFLRTSTARRLKVTPASVIGRVLSAREDDDACVNIVAPEERSGVPAPFSNTETCLRATRPPPRVAWRGQSVGEARQHHPGSSRRGGSRRAWCART